MSIVNISGFAAKSGASFNEFVSERLQTILDFDRESFSASSIKFWDLDGATSMTLGGKGLSYKYKGKEVVGITKGTITSFTAIAEGQKVFAATGLSLSGPALAKAIDSGNSKTFLNAFLSGNDTIKATKYADVFWGGEGNDTLYGYDGNDTMSGGNGIDTLIGGNGNDRLKGDAGNDTLKGDAGNDFLEGGAGADKLHGGTGQDTFIFRAKTDSLTTASDKIFGFSQKEKDKIDLSAFDANSKLASIQDFNFIGTQTFHKKAGELRYEIKNGSTLVHGDLDADGKADFTIVLDTAVKLGLGDFIL